MADENKEQSDLAQHISELPPVDNDGEPVEAILTKFVLVAEWMDGEGSRYLTKRSANGVGENITPWDSKGMLFEALFGAFDR